MICHALSHPFCCGLWSSIFIVVKFVYSVSAWIMGRIWTFGLVHVLVLLRFRPCARGYACTVQLFSVSVCNHVGRYIILSSRTRTGVEQRLVLFRSRGCTGLLSQYAKALGASCWCRFRRTGVLVWHCDQCDLDHSGRNMHQLFLTQLQMIATTNDSLLSGHDAFLLTHCLR